MVAVLVFAVSSADAATRLTQIGRSPFYQPPLTTVDSLRAMVASEQADVKIGFEKAGRPDLYEPFITQINTTEVELIDFQKGAWFEWMFFKKKGVGAVRVAKDVTWVSDNTFPGFQFDIESEGTIYTFVVPLGCGNIALMGDKPAPLPPPEPAPAPPVVVAPVNQAPQCGMTVSSVRAFCGEIITVDASGSNDADGTIEKMTIAFVDDQGQVVSEQVVDGALVADVKMPCGANTLKVTLIDNEGETSAEGECTAAVNGVKRTRFLADLGYYRQFDPANYLFGRVGLEYKFTDQFALLGLVGGALHVEGIDGESALLLDLIGEYSFAERFFVDLGIGGWISDEDLDSDDDPRAEDSQLDLIAGFGARVYGEPEEFNASLFFEMRSAFDELGQLYDYGRFGVGVRFRF